MVYKTGNSTLDKRFDNINRTVLAAKQTAQALSNQIANGQSLSGDQILGFGNTVANLIDRSSNVIGNSALETKARDQFNDQLYEFSTEATAVRDAAQAIANLIIALPKSPDGQYYLINQVGANGASSSRAFPPRVLSDFKTALDAFIATIE